MEGRKIQRSRRDSGPSLCIGFQVRLKRKSFRIHSFCFQRIIYESPIIMEIRTVGHTETSRKGNQGKILQM